MLPEAKKSLGQHWLTNKDILQAIADEAELTSDDLVIEIGSGPGSLTDIILKKACSLVAIEFDADLYENLKSKYAHQPNLQVVNQDVLKYDFSEINRPFKIVANIPYYLTSNLIRILAELKNPPELACLLVQKEVAERIAADPGQMSKLSVFAQNSFKASLGPIVQAEHFTPPPKVDSQVIILKKRPAKMVPAELEPYFSQVVKAGFSAKRKKLRGSISGGLRLPKNESADLLRAASINPDERAQSLNLNDWLNLAKCYKAKLPPG